MVVLIVAAVIFGLVFCALAVGLCRAAAGGEQVDAARREEAAVREARFKREKVRRPARER